MAPSELQYLLNEIVRLGATPGVAVALTRGGERAFAAACNPAGAIAPSAAHSRIQLGCIAKLLTAIVALELAADRQLDLDAAIDSYLPELRGTLPGQRVRPRHLLTHSSGYRGPNIADPAIRYYYSWSKLVELLRQGSTLFHPGTFFNYEHTESVLLGEILTRLTNTDILELHRRLILAPLGIDPTHPEGNDIGEHSFDPNTRRFTRLRAAPRCEFWRASLGDSTLRLADLLKLTEAAAGADPGRILRSETVAMLRQPQISLPVCIGGSAREEIPTAFGSGCAQYGNGVFGHNGSARGQTCALRYDPRTCAATVVALNAWRPDVRDMLCRKLLGSAAGDAAADTLPNWVFRDVAGTYGGAIGTSAEVREQDGELVCTLHAGSSGRAVRLTVTRNADGRLSLASEAPQLTLGFHRPDAAESQLMIAGLSTYRRVG